jgi:DNA-binding MarR family transcriptional regulator
MDEGSLAQSLHALVAALDIEAERLLTERFGLTHSQLAFLAPLLHAETLDVSSLATAVGVSVPAVSKRTTWFEERGLVQVDAVSAKGRRVLLSLTPKGRRLATAAIQALDDGLTSLFAGFPASRRDEFLALVLQLLDTVRGNSPAATRKEGTTS